MLYFIPYFLNAENERHENQFLVELIEVLEIYKASIFEDSEYGGVSISTEKTGVLDVVFFKGSDNKLYAEKYLYFINENDANPSKAELLGIAKDVLGPLLEGKPTNSEYVFTFLCRINNHRDISYHVRCHRWWDNERFVIEGRLTWDNCREKE